MFDIIFCHNMTTSVNIEKNKSKVIENIEYNRFTMCGRINPLLSNSRPDMHIQYPWLAKMPGPLTHC